jgi:hypothetical protein
MISEDASADRPITPSKHAYVGSGPLVKMPYIGRD